jgi:hypothetical protein
MKEIEDRILEVLSASQGNILEDESTITVITEAKRLGNEIAAKQRQGEVTEAAIDAARVAYAPCGAFLSTLFFCISGELVGYEGGLVGVVSWLVDEGGLVALASCLPGLTRPDTAAADTAAAAHTQTWPPLTQCISTACHGSRAWCWPAWRRQRGLTAWPRGWTPSTPTSLPTCTETCAGVLFNVCSMAMCSLSHNLACPDWPCSTPCPLPCRGLFEKDKLLFAFLLVCRILGAKGQLQPDEWMFLLTGGLGQ